MTLMIALFECLSYASLKSEDMVIGDTFGLVLGRDPPWSKRPMRKLKLLEWLTESSTVSLALQWTEKRKAALNDNKIERAK